MTRKKLTKLTALLCAGLLAGAMLPAGSVSANDPPPTVPDWVPADYISTVNFLNRHGRTHIADGAFCFVITQNADCTRTWKEDYQSETTLTANPHSEVLSDEIIRFTAPEDPGEMPEGLTKEEQQAWYEKEKAWNDYQRTVEFYGEDAYSTLPVYEVVTLFSYHVGTSCITVSSPEPDGPTAEYRFELDLRGIRETDELSWMPDCMDEFDDFVEKNGTFSLQENGQLLVIAGSYNGSTGASFRVAQNGAEAQLLRTSSIPVYRADPALPSGTGSSVIQCYAPAEGLTYFTVFSGIPWAPPETHQAEVSAVSGELTAAGTIAAKFEAGALCDLNADGRIDMADLELLCRFLVGDAELNDAQMQIADMNDDRQVNALDLTAIKQLLFTDWIPAEDPVIIIDDPVLSADE